MPRFLYLLYLFLLTATLSAQGVFDANVHTAVALGETFSFPNEEVQMVIDQDPLTKFIDSETTDGMSFEVDLGEGNAVVVTSMSLTTANDVPGRDQVEYEIFGSNDGDDFESIHFGEINCINERFFLRTFSFENEEAYSIYRFEFFVNCSGQEPFGQIADVQLYTAIGNIPQMSCPGPLVTVNDPGGCEAVIDYSVSVEDVEDGTLEAVLNFGLPSGGAFPVGTTPVAYTALDSDGNLASCDFTITVNDEEAPQFECPEDLVIEVEDGNFPISVNYNLEVTDNCGLTNPIAGFIPLETVDGRSFYVSEFAATGPAALENAISFGGFPATVESEETNELIVNALSRVGVSSPVLIGFNDTLVEDEFVWFDETPTDFEFWFPGEPNNAGVGGEDENYTVLVPGTGGLWNDVAASQAFPYILEVPYELLQIEGMPSGTQITGPGEIDNRFLAVDIHGNEETCAFNISVMLASATNDPALTAGISLSPNPAHHLLLINNETGSYLENVELISSNGKLLRSFSVKSSNERQTIDVSGLVPGLYLLRIHGIDGSTIKKFVRQ